MIPEEAARVINLLIERTKAKLVSWDTAQGAGISSSGSEDFVTSWPEYSANVYRPRGEREIWFAILNSEGETALSFQCEPTDPDYSTMQSLLALALRSARGADEALEYLEKALT